MRQTSIIGSLMKRKATRRGWSNTVAATGWGESTYAELAWDKSRSAGMRWGIAGAVVGTLVALVAFAPAAWLAAGVASFTDQRLLLTEARGTVWSGSAVPVLTGGPGSRDASALPGRLEWTLGMKGTSFELRARHACCLNGTVTLQFTPGLGRRTVKLLPPAGGWIGQWPTAWLSGVGAPFNTMQLGGNLRLMSNEFTVESVQGRWRLQGFLDAEFAGVSSRLSTLDTLGSYRLRVGGDPANPGTPQISLSTLEGALQLDGRGTWGPGGLRFRAEARAAPGDEAALANLLNIIGRRDGARSVISIG
jgi:general secretion pathway protein N